MSLDPTRAAGRRYRKRLKLGDKPICAFDGETAPEALSLESRTWLEAHHVFGFAHDPDTTLRLCLNCHAKVSAGQVDDGVPMRKQGTELERQHAMLCAWASFSAPPGGRRPGLDRTPAPDHPRPGCRLSGLAGGYMGSLTASLKIALRAFIERRPARVPLSKPKLALGWPESVLIFDTETTTDWTQQLLFGCYRWGHFDSTGGFVCQEAGIFHADDLADADIATLQAYVQSHAPVHPKRRQPELALQSRRTFVNGVFSKAIRDGALIVGFNLPFDLTRLAIGVGAPRGNPMFRGGFSVPLFERIVAGLRPRENQYRPRALLKAIDSKRSLMGVTLWKDAPKVGGKLDVRKLGSLLDLRALVFALTGASHSLNSAATAFGLPLRKLPVLAHGVITADYVDLLPPRCRADHPPAGGRAR